MVSIRFLWTMKTDTRLPTTPFGIFQYNRIPMGLTNNPATFQSLMQTSLNDYIFQILPVYLNDIIVYSNTFDENIERLDNMG